MHQSLKRGDIPRGRFPVGGRGADSGNGACTVDLRTSRASTDFDTNFPPLRSFSSLTGDGFGGAPVGVLPDMADDIVVGTIVAAAALAAATLSRLRRYLLASRERDFFADLSLGLLGAAI
jgi:hypothetical protein